MSSSEMTGAGAGPGSHSYGYPDGHYDYSPRGTWADVVGLMAGTLLGMVSLLQILEGIAAIAQDDLYASGVDYVYRFDTTAWGWTHVVVGVLCSVVAVGILARRSWGQVTGITVAVLSTIANFAFLPHYPLWSLTIIGFNVLIVCALCAQLRAPAPERGD